MGQRGMLNSAFCYFGMAIRMADSPHAVFHAGSIFLMKAASALEQSSASSAEILRDLEKCIGALEGMRIPTLAAWNANTLRALREQWLFSVSDLEYSCIVRAAVQDAYATYSQAQKRVQSPRNR
ncbi:hypothetical protein I302_103136 [Kwoniella bestiolae CBS 10118]|uniref:Uncharacterized protein n=1 Tax=Kwoniella bestiolae CBS 10118 TaxID=1296100 RepID=A0A1B9G7P1_9TREE|nr:hypothetical protein I302_01835 [Kwoniella bestiolae CBS 10118]OCF27000.1 hypothetical protein I302_01835 [Kwoniella bestiolae CBS 10118]